MPISPVRGIPGIQGIDTRALTRHLRTAGAMRAALTTDPALSAADAVELARRSPPMSGSDFVHEVTTDASYQWDEDDSESGAWTLDNPCEPAEWRIPVGRGEFVRPLPPIRHRIVAYDFGIKRDILRSLRQTGFSVEVVPASTPADEVLARQPDGIFLSNGPGDPGHACYDS